MASTDGFLDRVTDLAGKAKDLAEQHPDQVEQAVDRVADAVDRATDGRFSEHIERIGDQVGEGLTRER